MNWTEIPVYRGINEIEPLLDLLDGIEGVYILGGYVRYCCSPKKDPYPAQDVDLFFRDQETYDDVFAKIYKKGFISRAENDQANTLRYKYDSDDDKYERKWALVPTVQLIKPQTEGAIVTEGSLETILKNFDFTVVRVGLIDRNTALADERFLEDEEEGFLFLRNIHCPISSTLRAIKYGRKGYWMNTRNAFKLFADWDSRSPDYRMRIAELIEKEWDDLTQKEIDELEALMRID